jgi:hypothetical protein
MSAAGALINMAAEGSGATARNGPQDLDMGPAEPEAVECDEVCSRAANDVGHLEPWPTHLLLLGRPAFLELEAKGVARSSALAISCYNVLWHPCFRHGAARRSGVDLARTDTLTDSRQIELENCG